MVREVFNQDGGKASAETTRVDKTRALTADEAISDLFSALGNNNEIASKISAIQGECKKNPELIDNIAKELAQSVVYPLGKEDKLKIKYEVAKEILEHLSNINGKFQSIFYNELVNNILGGPEIDDSRFEKMLISFFKNENSQEGDPYKEFKNIINDIVNRNDPKLVNDLLRKTGETISKNTDFSSLRNAINIIRKNDVFKSLNLKIFSTNLGALIKHVYKTTFIDNLDTNKLTDKDDKDMYKAFNIISAKSNESDRKDFAKRCIQEKLLKSGSALNKDDITKFAASFVKRCAQGTWFSKHKTETLKAATSAIKELIEENPNSQKVLSQLGKEIANQTDWKIGEFGELGFDDAKGELLKESITQSLKNVESYDDGELEEILKNVNKIKDESVRAEVIDEVVKQYCSPDININDKDNYFIKIGSLLKKTSPAGRSECIALYAKKASELCNESLNKNNNDKTFSYAITNIKSALKILSKPSQIETLQKIALNHSTYPKATQSIIKTCSRWFTKSQKLMIAEKAIEGEFKNILKDSNSLEEHIKNINTLYKDIGCKAPTNKKGKAYIDKKLLEAVNKQLSENFEVNTENFETITKNLGDIHKRICSEKPISVDILCQLAKKEAEIANKFSDAQYSRNKNTIFAFALESVEVFSKNYYGLDNGILRQKTLCEVVNSIYKDSSFKNSINLTNIKKIYDLTNNFKITGKEKIAIFLNLAESPESKNLTKNGFFGEKSIDLLHELYKDVLSTDNEEQKQRFVALAVNADRRRWVKKVLGTLSVTQDNFDFLTEQYNSIKTNNYKTKRIFAKTITRMSKYEAETKVLDSGSVFKALIDITNYERSSNFTNSSFLSKTMGIVNYIPLFRHLTYYGNSVANAYSYAKNNGLSSYNEVYNDFRDNNKIFLHWLAWDATKWTGRKVAQGGIGTLKFTGKVLSFIPTRIYNQLRGNNYRGDGTNTSNGGFAA